MEYQEIRTVLIALRSVEAKLNQAMREECNLYEASAICVTAMQAYEDAGLAKPEQVEVIEEETVTLQAKLVENLLKAVEQVKNQMR